MKSKFLLASLIMMLFCTFLNSQLFAQTTGVQIQTEQGNYTVDNGTITLSVDQWNSIADGSQYTVDGRFPITITICIRIARQSNDCHSGLGFRCGFLSCHESVANLNGRKSDRTYSATIRTAGTGTDAGTGTVTLTFNEDVDWVWLAN